VPLAAAADGAGGTTSSRQHWQLSARGQLNLTQLGGGVDHGLAAAAAKPAPTLFEDLEGEVSGLTGRITAMTLAEGLDRQKMEKLLKARYAR